MVSTLSQMQGRVLLLHLSSLAGHVELCPGTYRKHKLRTVRVHAWECDPTPSGWQLGQADLTCCFGSGVSGA